MIWRACERMGIDVRTLGMESPEFVAKLVAFEQIRLEEESRLRVAMMRARM